MQPLAQQKFPKEQIVIFFFFFWRANGKPLKWNVAEEPKNVQNSPCRTQTVQEKVLIALRALAKIGRGLIL